MKFTWYVESYNRHHVGGVKWSSGLVWLVLLVVSWMVYGQIVGHRFVNFDDPMYIYENGHVTAGLTPDGFVWAWTNKDVLQWHPLTWLGHMFVCEVSGIQPGAHLFINLLMHWLNAGLVFTCLRSATMRSGCSFTVALLFALHPVNVETVAWASQLKSTLSTAFFLMTLIAYVRFVRSGSRTAYWGAVATTALSLLAKPMLVSLPLVLGLMDYWPLGRFQAEKNQGSPLNWRRSFWEKTPFVLLALIGAVVTAWPWGPHRDLHTVHGLEWDRVGVVPLNYVRYLGMFVWPVDLAVFYPESLGGPAALKSLAAGLLIVISVMVWLVRRTTPVLLAGWSWFLITLMPVSGLVRLGPQGWADRYLYVPMIGLLIALVWVGADSFPARSKRFLAVAVIFTASVYGMMAHAQAAYWKNSLTLWQREVSVVPPNAVQHLNLGNALLDVGRDSEAAEEFKAVLATQNTDPRPYINLAVIAQRHGNSREAIRLLRHALLLAPEDARIYSNLGSLLQDAGELPEARINLQQAIKLRPDSAEAHTNLGTLLAGEGDLSGALKCFAEAVRLKPGDAVLLHNLELAQRQLRSQGATVSHEPH